MGGGVGGIWGRNFPIFLLNTPSLRKQLPLTAFSVPPQREKCLRFELRNSILMKNKVYREIVSNSDWINKLRYCFIWVFDILMLAFLFIFCYSSGIHNFLFNVFGAKLLSKTPQLDTVQYWFEDTEWFFCSLVYVHKKLYMTTIYQNVISMKKLTGLKKLTG